MSNTSRRGFTLLLTLVLLAIAATAMAAVARRSLSAAAQAEIAEQALQAKWAERSLTPLVNEAEVALDSGAGRSPVDTDRRKPSTTTLTTRLGELNIELTFADEQAKLPVNRLIDELGTDETGRLLRRQLASEVERTVELRSIDRFVRQLNDIDDDRPAVESFSQLFASGPANLRTDAADARRASEQCTLWGEGTFNLERVSSETLAATLGPTLTRRDAQQLIEAAAEGSLDEALSDLIQSDEARARIVPWLTVGTQTTSLWIRLEGLKREHQLLIVRDDSASPPRLRRLAW